MRDVIIAVAIVLCLGCAGPHQSGTQTHSVEPARRSDSAAGRRETITELVEKSEIIVLGHITGIRDGMARDAGVGYDVVLETVLYGSDVPPDVLRFRSEGRVGYARYRMDERVLLFLTRRHDELIQVHPACYIAGEPATGGLALRPVEDYLDFIRSEIKSKKNGM
jgi:hypothetical protein